MKTKLLLLLLIFTTSYLNAQVVNIPDPNFLHRLLNHAHWFGGQHIDTNSNNQIEVSEAEAITTLILGSNIYEDYLINDMTGIEAFINITSLQCTYNEIGVLNLSQNTQLQFLDCSYNNINTLNVSQCTALVELNCRENELTSLDVSQNTGLFFLRSDDNFLTALSVNNNSLLETLTLNRNNLTTININQNTVLKKF